jgi:hypothetical protein
VGLLEKLLAAVRPEFRADLLVPSQDDPVLGWDDCAVPGCDRPSFDYELCNGHGQQWRRRGDRDRAAFLADPGPPLRGRTELTGCAVPTCRYSASGHGLCSRHRYRWQRAGHPDPTAWAAVAPAVADPATQAACRLAFCTLWAMGGGHGLCESHAKRWSGDGKRDLAEFVADCERHGMAFIDFRGLTPQLKLEMQYAVQCRCDEQTVTLPLYVANWAARRAREAGVASLLDRPAED